MGTRLRDLLRHPAAGRGRLLLAAGLLLALAPATTALAADSLTLSISPAQPTDAGPVQITAQGTATDDLLYVYYQPAGTGDCAASPATSGGAAVSPNLTTVGPGSFDVQGEPQTYDLGSYLACAWLTDPSNSGTVLAPVAQLPFTVTAADTLSLSPPATVIAGQPFDVTAIGTAYDSSAVIDATYKPAGGSCASTPGADTGAQTDLSGVGVSAGAYTVTPSSQLTLSAGSYLFCAWMVDTMYPAPLAAASQTVIVHPPQASLQLVAPARVDGGQTFIVALHADVSAGVPLVAVADLKPAVSGSGCAANPAGEPAAAMTELDTQFTGTQQPTGAVTETNTEAETPSFGTYLLCGWLLAGWTGDQTPPTVAGPVTAMITAVPPESFRGRTSQRLPITITVAPVERLVLALGYSDRLRCRGVARFPDGLRWNGTYTNQLNQGTFGTLRLNSAGKFHSNLTGNRNHTLKITGTLSGRKIRGTLAEQGKSFAFTGNSAQHNACHTGAVHYTATAR